MGGGVAVRTGATLSLPGSAIVDNNNAALAGDDVYVEEGGSITLGQTHADALAEFGGCGHVIDSWYDDAQDARWSAHGEEKHVEAIAAGSYELPLALKAAHGLVSVDYQYVGTRPTSAELPETDSELEVGAPYTAKTQTTVDGWTFDGWYADEACTTKWVDGTALPGSMTLYGKWSKNPVAPSTPEAPATPSSSTKPKDKKELPQTGDGTASAASLAALGGSVAVVGAGVTLRRRSH